MKAKGIGLRAVGESEGSGGAGEFMGHLKMIMISPGIHSWATRDVKASSRR